ncbi:hypothetical protein MicvaDRAFT_0639 [Microcoleus vaginatus FGP-2]|jgi:hypothetical protein|nr:hypothetical protein MicvaDRAFT_0639 [Microcoleus vaginatus FGP-2]
MPTPQENLLFVEQASCLLLRMMQYVGVIDILWPCQKTVRDEFYQI